MSSNHSVIVHQLEGFNYIWWFKKFLGERKGKRCKVLARGNGKGPRNVLVEFEDGFKVVGTRFCVRKAKEIDNVQV